jgi:hypothetical protein
MSPAAPALSPIAAGKLHAFAVASAPDAALPRTRFTGIPHAARRGRHSASKARVNALKAHPGDAPASQKIAALSGTERLLVGWQKHAWPGKGHANNRRLLPKGRACARCGQNPSFVR